nr:hypothetical protein [Tanacetum cinerariifolium]
MVEEPLKMKKKDQISFDEQEARRLQAEFDEQDKLAKEKSQLIEDENLAWDNVQAMMDADCELAARLQEEGQGELTTEEKSRLFVELMDKRKKHFKKIKVEEKRGKPPTKAQKRNQMCVYLKNMVGLTHIHLQNKSFNKVQKAFNKTMSWINSFVPIDFEVVKNKVVLTQESSSKRAGDKLDQGRSKKQKVEDDKEQKELKRCLEIIPDDGDDVTIDATSLSIKTLIINYMVYKEGKNIKARFEKLQPVDEMDSFLLHTLKTMFEHHVEDTVWRNQQGLAKVKNWKLFYSCGVHCVTMQNTVYYLLVERMCPLTNQTLHQMFNNVKLQVDEECEMAFELLRLVKKQLKEGYKPN